MDEEYSSLEDLKDYLKDQYLFKDIVNEALLELKSNGIY